MFKNKKVVLIVLSIMLVLITGSLAFSKSKYEAMGEAVKLQSEKSQILIATVNGTPITSNDIEKNFIRSSKLESPPKTKEQIFDRKVKYIVVVQEAKRLNLYPSDEEVKDFLSQLQEQFSNDENLNKPVNEYLNGLGLSEDEYFKEHFEGYREKIAYGNLMKYVTKDIEGTNDEMNKVFNEYVNDLVNKAEIQLLDPSYIK